MTEKRPSFTDIVGRRVDFTQRRPLAWGIEIDIPIKNNLRKRVWEESGIKLPQSVTTIKYLDLNPQESLHPRLRNIESDWKYYKETSLQDLANVGIREEFADRENIRIERLAQIFYLMFGKNKDQIFKFNHILFESCASQIVIVYGHGGKERSFVLGEQSSHQPYDESQSKLQKMGNTVHCSKIIQRYNNSEKYAGILLATCCFNEIRIRSKVPIVYVIGSFESKNSWKGQLQTYITGHEIV